MRTLPYMRRTIMLPLNGGLSALKEKPILASNSLGLSDTASQIGDRDRPIEQTLLLDQDATSHVNNAEDPATDTMTLSDSAALVMERPRSLTSNIVFTDAAHVSLDGYHPVDKTVVTMTAGEDIDKGQPVVCLTANTVNLANNYLGSPSNNMLGYVIGLASVDASAGDSIQITTEGVVEKSDWYSIIGRTTLEPGAWYYLNGATAGKMTVNAVTTIGRMAIRCGRALDTTRFDIEISDGVIL